MKQIEVQIMGQSYILACTPETEGTLRHAVMKVDTTMCQIRDAGKLKARERIAVLAALNIAASALEDAQHGTTTQALMPHAVMAGDDPATTAMLAKLDSVLADD